MHDVTIACGQLSPSECLVSADGPDFAWDTDKKRRSAKIIVGIPFGA